MHLPSGEGKVGSAEIAFQLVHQAESPTLLLRAILRLLLIQVPNVDGLVATDAETRVIFIEEHLLDLLLREASPQDSD